MGEVIRSTVLTQNNDSYFSACLLVPAHLVELGKNSAKQTIIRHLLACAQLSRAKQAERKPITPAQQSRTRPVLYRDLDIENLHSHRESRSRRGQQQESGKKEIASQECQTRLIHGADTTEKAPTGQTVPPQHLRNRFDVVG
tara:strand:- start:234 stop:659 length:426 start_codon:yes stop_codon:yes gene_type:complete